MVMFDEERPSDSPFVERIWRSHSEGTALFLSIAVSRCELVVTKLHGKITMIVRGPTMGNIVVSEFITLDGVNRRTRMVHAVLQ
jgi:hypothetical protein